MIRGFLDTNILLYSVSGAPADLRKRSIARALIDEDGWGLSVQVLQEFYVQATRKSRSDPMPHELAERFVRAWMRFRIQATTPSILLRALELRAAHGFSYWDSAIVAAALALGAKRLFTEDLSHGQMVEGVEIVDPFR